MIKYNPKNWLGLVLDVYSRYVIQSLFPTLLFFGCYSALLCYLLIDFFDFEYQGTLAFHSILGVVLGLFLVLRTNTAYDRWWEGRKIWGALVNDSRNLAIKINTFLPVKDDEGRTFFRLMIPNIVFAMKERLRDSILIGELTMPSDVIKEKIKSSEHRPNIINRMMYEKLIQYKKDGVLSGDDLFLLDKEMKGFTDIIGACERIKTTPIPHSYSMFIKKFIFIYLGTLPFGFIDHFHYWTVLFVVICAYFLVSVELIAEEIEDPFGIDINDLPLDALSRKIKGNVEEIIE